jgi:pseudo-rSAM protein
MISTKNVTSYWFTIESYVYIGIANRSVLLYNTLDGVTIESDKVEVIELLQEILLKENCGVILLTSDRYKRKEINSFIRILREKYMGDIIDVALSKSKPVQLLPFFNLSDKHELYKKHNFSPYKNILENLSEISIHIDNSTNVTKLISFLQFAPGNLTFNIIGNIVDVADSNKLMSFFDQYSSPKYILCSYSHLSSMHPTFENNFSYIILVHFPIDSLKWSNSRQMLLNQTLPFEYVFDVSSLDDCQQAMQLIEQFRIEKYQLKPVYTGDNISFFEESLFLTKEDILSSSISIKDIFANQSVNIYDFGKINIVPSGDVFANVNHPALGNICTHNIHEIVQNEVENGKSWFRVRNQAPCSTCTYQWLCPSPSDYEIVIGRPNLCHIKQNR